MNFVDRFWRGDDRSGEGASKRKARYERMTTKLGKYSMQTHGGKTGSMQMPAWLNFDRNLRSNGVLREKLAAFSFSFIRRRNLLRERNKWEIKDMRNICRNLRFFLFFFFFIQIFFDEAEYFE